MERPIPNLSEVYVADVRIDCLCPDTFDEFWKIVTFSQVGSRFQMSIYGCFQK